VPLISWKNGFVKRLTLTGHANICSLHAMFYFMMKPFFHSSMIDVLRSALKSSQASSSTNVFSKPTTSLSASIFHCKMGSWYMQPNFLLPDAELSYNNWCRAFIRTYIDKNNKKKIITRISNIKFRKIGLFTKS